MKPGNYPTPAQVSIFLKEIWLDDAYRVEVRDENRQIPLYGYSESEFTAVAQGKRLVNGSLIINYRYPEYLRAAIDNHGKKRVEMDRTVALAHVLREASIEDRISILELARQQGVGKEMGEVFADKYFPEVEVIDPNMTEEQKDRLAEAYYNKNPSVSHLPSSMRVDPDEEISIKVMFDTPNRAKYYTIIEGVHLVGRAMTIRNSAQGGGDASSSGQNLYELYTFFARRISNRRLHRWEPDPTLPGYGVTDQEEILGGLIATPEREGSES